MEITEKIVDYTAELSRLEVSPGEKAEVQAKMQQIVSYMDKLQEIDTTGIEPLSHNMPLTNVFHEDEVKPSLPREEILKNAPVPDPEAFLVPKAVE